MEWRALPRRPRRLVRADAPQPVDASLTRHLRIRCLRVPWRRLRGALAAVLCSLLQYLRSWFLMDLVSTLPWDLMFNAINQSSEADVGA